jgi:hypothetical protein
MLSAGFDVLSLIKDHIAARNDKCDDVESSYVGRGVNIEADYTRDNKPAPKHPAPACTASISSPTTYMGCVSSKIPKMSYTTSTRNEEWARRIWIALTRITMAAAENTEQHCAHDIAPAAEA